MGCRFDRPEVFVSCLLESPIKNSNQLSFLLRSECKAQMVSWAILIVLNPSIPRFSAKSDKIWEIGTSEVAQNSNVFFLINTNDSVFIIPVKRFNMSDGSKWASMIAVLKCTPQDHIFIESSNNSPQSFPQSHPPRLALRVVGSIYIGDLA